MMNDEKLYGLCKRYSKLIRYGRQKFIGLLPEVYKSRMFERKGFGSIYEFAAKLAYMSREQVDLVLNMNRKFEDKPALQALLIKGEVSVNKLARVVSIATADNASALAEQVKILPQKALETLVRDVKSAQENGSQDGVQKPLLDDKSLRAQTMHGAIRSVAMSKITMLMNLEIDTDLVEKLYDMQEKAIDINDMLRKMLAAHEAGISSEKNAIGEAEIMKAEKKASECGGRAVAAEGRVAKDERKTEKPSRYISVKVRKILKQEHGDKCSIPQCKKSASQIHHAQRFALAGTHDPRYMAPLCDEHHKIAHAIDQKTQEKWRSG